MRIKRLFKETILLIILSPIMCTAQPTLSEKAPITLKPGSFAYDLNFLKKYDSVIVLSNKGAKIIVSAKYQAKVFTSTVAAGNGKSFGWINYKAFSAEPNIHMNAYGGENRLWLGPEGNKYSLFFKKGDNQVFENWTTPSGIDNEPWLLKSSTNKEVVLTKQLELTNYSGTDFRLSITRRISLIDNKGIALLFNIASLPKTIKAVGYTTENGITNTGVNSWNEESGAPCIWMLDMFPPSENTVIIIPYNAAVKDAVTSNYFGEIPASRIVSKNNHLFFKADGKSRGKLGIKPIAANNLLGSYDFINKVLTIVLFDLVNDKQAKYLNQEWNSHKPAYVGDAVNAYNDGPLENGTQMGPFYELESVSPAAFLKPNETLIHHHTVVHFTGSEAVIDQLSKQILGVSIQQMPVMK